MNRKGITVLLAVMLGIALTGSVGYMIWQTAGSRYQAVETAGSDEAAADAWTEAARTDGDGGAGPGEAAPGESVSGELILEGNASGEDGLGENSQESQQAEDGAQDGTIHLVFAGDVLLSDHVLNAYNKTGDITGVLDEGLRQEISRGDIFMVNQEFPFSNRGSAAPDKQYTFRLPPEKVSMLGEMGIDIVTLANNHALDYGTDALVDSLDALDGAGIYHVGAGRNLNEAKALVTMETKGKTIGFLGASRVIPVGSWNASSDRPGMLTTYDPASLVAEIKKAREICDFVVVYVHWGIERDERPQDYQRDLGQQYIDAGADLVIGSHPHVLQGFEYYKGKPIVYSLGNFVFGSSIPRSALLRADWDGENVQLSMVPATSSAGYTRQVTDQAKRQEFFSYMTGISYGVRVDENGNIVSE